MLHDDCYSSTLQFTHKSLQPTLSHAAWWLLQSYITHKSLQPTLSHAAWWLLQFYITVYTQISATYSVSCCMMTATVLHYSLHTNLCNLLCLMLHDDSYSSTLQFTHKSLQPTLSHAAWWLLQFYITVYTQISATYSVSCCMMTAKVLHYTQISATYSISCCVMTALPSLSSEKSSSLLNSATLPGQPMEPSDWLTSCPLSPSSAAVGVTASRQKLAVPDKVIRLKQVQSLL